MLVCVCVCVYVCVCACVYTYACVLASVFCVAHSANSEKLNLHTYPTPRVGQDRISPFQIPYIPYV